MNQLKFEYKITAAYLIVGGLWILFSDELLFYFIQDSDLLSEVQTYKGWFYVIITAALLYSFLKKHLEKLRLAEMKAKESDRLQSAFLQNISHEIRTPMNGIIGFSTLLNNDLLSDNQKKHYLQIITRSSDQLLSIINDVLDISLIETGNIQAYNESFSLNQLLDELYFASNPLMKEGVSLTLSKGLSEAQSMIMSDERKVRQIMNNLLNNAIKFTDEGFINFGYQQKNNELEFFVHDSGIGIATDLHDKIFNRFHKAELEITRLYEGIGLGLAICKGNVNLLGGRIWVESVLTKGSTFYFTIPYLLSKRTDIQELSESNSHEVNPINHILVVEDDQTTYQYLEEILTDQGYPIYRAVNGKEAVELCFKHRKIKMVLMDIKLPVMNGLEATKLIKKEFPEMIIIAQTAFTENEHIKFDRDAGFDGYLSKPFSKEQLINMIKIHEK
ncbi:MAG: response regulator [Bacteroidales bacterium]|nr:response regulator [Bacteroidales bacterium]